MSASQSGTFNVQEFSDLGAPLVGGRLYTYAYGTTTQKTAYTDHAGAVPHTYTSDGIGGQYIALNSRGELPAPLYLTGGSYDIALKTALGATVWTRRADPVLDIVNDLSTSSGASLVGYLPSGTGAVATTVQSKLREQYDAINDFGADNTGATNTTTALLNFYNACISSGKKGKIRAGTYKVTTGVLVFDNGFIDKAWPHIETDGHHSTVFQIDSATETNAAVLTWSNGTASSGVGKYWRGGSHGGLTVVGSGTGSAYANQHHYSLTGTWAIDFGYMASTNCKGNSFHLPANLYGGTNPDPYANTFLHFAGIESNFAVGYGFYNGNYVGMDSWEVDHIRIIQPTLGGWFGIGSGNRLNDWSVANTQGWAFDDGCYTASTGGSPQRNYINIAEFDNCKYGIRINKSSRTKFIGVRMPTRFQTTPNATALYWPLIGIDIAGGTSPNVFDVDLDVQWRVESGGVLANLGPYLTTTASGLFNLTADYLDNGTLGITDTNFLAGMTGLTSSSPATITRRTRPLWNSENRNLFLAWGSAATTVPNSGFGTISSKLTFGSSRYLTSSLPYDATTSTFTAVEAGPYHYHVHFPLAVAIGTLVRTCLMVTGTQKALKQEYSVNATNQFYGISGTIVLAAGDTVYVSASQNTGTASVACNVTSSNDEVQFTMNAI